MIPFNSHQASILILVGILLLTLGCSEKPPVQLTPPVAVKIEKALTLHGDTRIDPYYWLNERENPEVIAYLEAENAYMQSKMAHTEKLQKKLYEEIVGRMKQDDASVPYLDNDYYYYNRYEKGQEYPLYARKKGRLNAKEEILLNVPEMAEGYDYFNARGLSVSEDNNILAFGVDTVSRRKYTIHFKDLRTGQILADKIPNTTGRTVWANDNRTLFYTTKDNTLRAYKIWRHKLGDDPSQDVVVWHEKDNTFSTSIYKTRSNKYLIIESDQTMAAEFRILEADNPDGEWRVFEKRRRGHEYAIAHHGDKWYIKTNWNAKNFRLMKTAEGRTSRRHWKEVIPHRGDALINSIDIFKDFLVISERKDALRQIRVIGLKNDTDHYIDFGQDIFVAYATDNHEFDTDKLRLKFASFITPGTVYDYDMSKQKLKELKQDEVIGKFNPDDYHSERLWTEARDGARVPISLVYPKDLKKDGQNPCLLRAYGSYGYSSDPGFRSEFLSLLERGFIIAIPHIRGGSEMGRIWYEDGKLLNKKNTFTDYIDCAEHLIAEGYTSADQLFAMGGSAGGLLMGAVANMRPDLFKGVLALVPFMDVVTTMLDDSIPLTTGEFDEWGNPKDKVYYDYMRSYSPYDNVEAKNYPAMLVTTGLHDSQVQYFEPAKWVAKLRDMKTDDNLLIIDIDMESGHGGASGRFKRYQRTGLEYAFMLDQLGIKK